MTITRRQLIGASLAGAVLWPTGVFSATKTEQRFIVILLRGAVDGLAMVPPIGDKHYGNNRKILVNKDTISLTDDFGLHPSLAPLLPMWKQNQLQIVHATGLIGASRSNFSSQYILESGVPNRHQGWLGLGINALFPEATAVALGQNVPLILRGAPEAFSLSAKQRRHASESFIDLVQSMYQEDQMLMDALNQSLQTKKMSENNDDEDKKQRAITGIGKMLSDPNGPRIAVIEIGGWDTHSNQNNRLNRKFSQLAKSLLSLQKSLGSQWDNTTILAVTEFGRTVAVNGTKGTDHGSGGAALLIGGGVDGGKVITDWPGLRKQDLFEGRDLRITTDVRSIFKQQLVKLFGMNQQTLQKIF